MPLDSRTQPRELIDASSTTKGHVGYDFTLYDDFATQEIHITTNSTNPRNATELSRELARNIKHPAQQLADALINSNGHDRPYIKCEIEGFGAHFLARELAKILRQKIPEYCTLPKQRIFNLHPIFRVHEAALQTAEEGNRIEANIVTRIEMSEKPFCILLADYDFDLDDILACDAGEGFNPDHAPASHMLGLPNYGYPFCRFNDNYIDFTPETEAKELADNYIWPMIHDAFVRNSDPNHTDDRIFRMDIAISSHQTNEVMKLVSTKIQNFSAEQGIKFPVSLNFYCHEALFTETQHILIYRDYPQAEKTIEPLLCSYHKKLSHNLSASFDEVRAAHEAIPYNFRTKPSTRKKRLIWISKGWTKDSEPEAYSQLREFLLSNQQYQDYEFMGAHEFKDIATFIDQELRRFNPRVYSLRGNIKVLEKVDRYVATHGLILIFANCALNS